MPTPYFKANGKEMFNGAIDHGNNNGDPATNNYYVMPYSDTHRLLIQFGCRPAGSGDQVTYWVPYTTRPFTFIQFMTLPSNGTAPPYIWDQTTTFFKIDAGPYSSTKPAFNFISIGLISP